MYKRFVKMRQTSFKKTLAILTILLFIGITINPVAGKIFGNKSVTSKIQVNLNDDLDFDRRITFLMKVGHIPSLSVCIIKNNKVVWSNGYGFYDIENKKPASDNTIYMLASQSKPVTATALMQLYEKGWFDLDDDVNKFLPFELRNPKHPDDPITFRMLLTHTASLAPEPDSFYIPIYGDDQPALSSWIEEYFYPNGSINHRVWLDIRPGKIFSYSNMGFCLAGYLVELISNQPFDKYCKEHIFMPLNMMNTSFRLSGIDADRLAVPYIFYYGRKLTRFKNILKEIIRPEPTIYIRLPHYSLPFYPAAGLRTSVIDFSHFLIAHMNGGVYNGVRILNESTVDLMHTRQSNAGKYKYGLGWQIIENRRGQPIRLAHGGSLYGYSGHFNIRLYDNSVEICFLNTETFDELNEKRAHRIIDFFLFYKTYTI